MHLTDVLTTEMNSAIKSAIDANKPFFAYMSHYAVHAPFQQDDRFAAHYENMPLKKPAKAFLSMIEGIDQSLGDLLDQLTRLGVAENTLVFFLGDNGTDAPFGKTHDISCAAPLRGKKGTHYEGGLRVPFIASWALPDADHPAQKRLPIPHGILSTQVGTIYDLFPTILHIIDSPYKSRAKLDGTDLSPLLIGASSNRIPTFLMHFPHAHRSSYFTSYRLGDWKLIYHYHQPETERYELYHLGNDRNESVNLHKLEPLQLNKMMKAMIAELDAANAQYPLSKSDPQKQLIPSFPSTTP